MPMSRNPGGTADCRSVAGAGGRGRSRDRPPAAPCRRSRASFSAMPRQASHYRPVAQFQTSLIPLLASL